MVQRIEIGELSQSIQAKGQAKKSVLAAQSAAITPKIQDQQKKYNAWQTATNVASQFAQIGTNIYQEWKQNKDEDDISNEKLAYKEAYDNWGIKVQQAFDNGEITEIDEEGNPVLSDDLMEEFNNIASSIQEKGYSKEVTEMFLNQHKEDWLNVKNEINLSILSKQRNDTITADNTALSMIMDISAKGQSNATYSYGAAKANIYNRKYMSDAEKDAQWQATKSQLDYNFIEQDILSNTPQIGLSKTYENINNNDNLSYSEKTTLKQKSEQVFNELSQKGIDFVNDLYAESMQSPVNFSGQQIANFSLINQNMQDFISSNGYGTELTNKMYQQFDNLQANTFYSSDFYQSSAEKSLANADRLQAQSSLVKKAIDGDVFVDLSSGTYQSSFRAKDNLNAQLQANNVQIKALYDADVKKAKLEYDAKVDIIENDAKLRDEIVASLVSENNKTITSYENIGEYEKAHTIRLQNAKLEYDNNYKKTKEKENLGLISAGSADKLTEIYNNQIEAINLQENLRKDALLIEENQGLYTSKINDYQKLADTYMQNGKLEQAYVYLEGIAELKRNQENDRISKLNADEKTKQALIDANEESYELNLYDLTVQKNLKENKIITDEINKFYDDKVETSKNLASIYMENNQFEQAYEFLNQAAEAEWRKKINNIQSLEISDERKQAMLVQNRQNLEKQREVLDIAKAFKVGEFNEEQLFAQLKERGQSLEDMATSLENQGLVSSAYKLREMKLTEDYQAQKTSLINKNSDPSVIEQLDANYKLNLTTLGIQEEEAIATNNKKREKEYLEAQQAQLDLEKSKADITKSFIENQSEVLQNTIDTYGRELRTNVISGNEYVQKVNTLSEMYIAGVSPNYDFFTDEEKAAISAQVANKASEIIKTELEKLTGADAKDFYSNTDNPIIPSEIGKDLSNTMTEVTKMIKGYKLDGVSEAHLLNTMNDFFVNGMMNYKEVTDLDSPHSYFANLKQRAITTLGVEIYKSLGSKELEKVDAGVYFDAESTGSGFIDNKGRVIADSNFKFLTPQLKESYNRAANKLVYTLEINNITVPTDVKMAPRKREDGGYDPLPVLKLDDGRVFTYENGKVIEKIGEENSKEYKAINVNFPVFSSFEEHANTYEKTGIQTYPSVRYY